MHTLSSSEYRLVETPLSSCQSTLAKYICVCECVCPHIFLLNCLCETDFEFIGFMLRLFVEIESSRPVRTQRQCRTKDSGYSGCMWVCERECPHARVHAYTLCVCLCIGVTELTRLNRSF